MNQDIVTTTFEQIDNQILRLLLYFGGAVILSLSSALAYLWNAWRNEQRERIELDKANAAALSMVANKLENFQDALAELSRRIEGKTNQ